MKDRQQLSHICSLCDINNRRLCKVLPKESLVVADLANHRVEVGLDLSVLPNDVGCMYHRKLWRVQPNVAGQEQEVTHHIGLGVWADGRRCPVRNALHMHVHGAKKVCYF